MIENQPKGTNTVRLLSYYMKAITLIFCSQRSEKKRKENNIEGNTAPPQNGQRQISSDNTLGTVLNKRVIVSYQNVEFHMSTNGNQERYQATSVNGSSFFSFFPCC